MRVCIVGLTVKFRGICDDCWSRLVEARRSKRVQTFRSSAQLEINWIQLGHRE